MEGVYQSKVTHKRYVVVAAHNNEGRYRVCSNTTFIGIFDGPTLVLILKSFDPIDDKPSSFLLDRREKRYRGPGIPSYNDLYTIATDMMLSTHTWNDHKMNALLSSTAKTREKFIDEYEAVVKKDDGVPNHI